MKLYKIIAVNILAATLFSACENKPTATQQKFTPSIPVISPLYKKVIINKEFVGQTYGLSDIPIRARVEGFLEAIHFQEGSRVQEGDLLYTVDSEPYLAKVANEKGELAEARTRMTKSKNDLDRYIPLAKTNAVSQSDLDAVQADYDASIASVNAAKASLDLAEIQLGYCKIESPIDGIIGKTQAKIGEFVGKNPNPVILNTVSNIDTMLVNFFLPENQYLDLAKNYINNQKENPNKKEKNIDIELVFSDNSIYDYKGHVDFIDRSINAKTGSILIQASFPNPNQLLRPGLYVKLRIPVNKDEKTILIPQRSITEIQGVSNVLKMNSNHTLEYQKVELGDKLDSLVIIKTGLNENDKIIYEGFQKVRAGDSIVPLMKKLN